MEKINYMILENGLKVVLQNVQTAPVISVYIAVNCGSMHENPLGFGLSHFLEHLVFKGTKKFPKSNQIADLVQDFGGYINAYTAKDHTCYFVDSLSKNLDKTLDILSSAVMEPLFPEDDFELEKEIILHEEASCCDDVNYQVRELGWKYALGNHHFSVPIIGFREKIQEVTREMVVNYFLKNYQPSNSELVIVGDFTNFDVEELVKKYFGKWQNNNFIVEKDFPILSQKSAKDEVTMYFDDNQSRLFYSYNLDNITGKNVAILEVFETLLTDGKSSRLQKVLKMQENAVLGLSSISYTVRNAGIFSFLLACETDKLEVANQLFFTEMDKIIAGEFSEEELKRAILQCKVTFLKQMQTVSDHAQLLVDAVISFKTPNFWGTYIVDVENVTCDDLMKFAKKYFQQRNVTVIRQLPLIEKKKNSQENELNEKNNVKFVEKILEKSKIPIKFYQHSSSFMMNLSMVFSYGSFGDEKGKEGSFHLLSRLLTTQINGFSEEELSDELSSNAIAINFSSGNNSFSCDCSFLPEKIEETFFFLENILLNKTFSESIFEREKNLLLHMLESRNRKVLTPAINAFTLALFGRNHPYFCPASGTIESVKNINISDIYNCLGKLFCREKIAISLVGANFEKKIFNKLDSIFSKINWSSEKIKMPKEPSFSGEEELLKIKSKFDKAVVLVGIPGIKCDKKNRFIADLLLANLNGQSSRIFKNIREKNGMAYSTGLSIRIGLHRGFFILYAETDSKKAKKCLVLLRLELKRLAEKGLTKKEFLTTKLQLISEKSFDLQDGKILATNNVLNQFYQMDYEKVDDEILELNRLSYEQSNEEIKKLFSVKRIISVIAAK